MNVTTLRCIVLGLVGLVLAAAAWAAQEAHSVPAPGPNSCG